MISLTNHDSQWGRSEVVIIYPDNMYTSRKECMDFQPIKFCDKVHQACNIPLDFMSEFATNFRQAQFMI